MPRRNDFQTVALIGSGPITIGQACEFDYSGTQACLALKEEGYRVVLINSNPASIMTDPELADATYIEPMAPELVAEILKKEKVDALLPTMGGQKALNITMKLYESGVLEELGIKILGASPESISKAEDRHKFYSQMQKIGLETPRGYQVSTFEEAFSALEKVGLPAIIRPCFTLGGHGGGIAKTQEEFGEIVNLGLSASPVSKVLIEESVLGWKEFELEVMRDRKDNCVIICSIENLDPMGVHTGDSITVAPALTLTDKEYQEMRDAAFKIIRAIGVETGGSNIQFAVHPETGRMVVIEMNPRVSRSSALASKATGFPIAKIAAKLAVGYTLDEIPNEINKKTSAAFEPAIDYLVCKIPRFNFAKLKVEDKLTTSMKSIGEVMALGRTFNEAFQKAISSLEVGLSGLDDIEINSSELETKLKNPSSLRFLVIAQALRQGMSVEKIAFLTKWDKWFVDQVKLIVDAEGYLLKEGLEGLKERLSYYKSIGFTDQRLATLTKTDKKIIHKLRNSLGVKSIYHRVDTCAAEFSSQTSYMYSTYYPFDFSGNGCEANVSKNKKIIIIGSGPNRIAQGIEFDYCCVHAAQTVKKMGIECVMINCNPETLSTDHSISDRLYFEPLSEEKILDIIEKETSEGELLGVLVQFGGQTSLKLASALSESNIPILGTSFNSIDEAEDRELFRVLASELNILQPKNLTASTQAELLEKTKDIGFPVILRPSYVIGGKGMEVINSQDELKNSISFKLIDELEPILIEQYLDGAQEIEVDVLCDGEDIHISGIMEHFEKAGIHSGDSTLLYPSVSIKEEVLALIEKQALQISQRLKVKGMLNIQYALYKSELYIIEVNPRASRTTPFISKARNIPFAGLAARICMGEKIKDIKFDNNSEYFYVKSPSFSFDRLPGIDPKLGVEMLSTGEIMTSGKSVEEATAKAMLETGTSSLGFTKNIYVSLSHSEYLSALPIIKKFEKQNFKIFCEEKTGEFLKANNVTVESCMSLESFCQNLVSKTSKDTSNVIFETNNGVYYHQKLASIRKSLLQKKALYLPSIYQAKAFIELYEQNVYINLNSLQSMNVQAKI